MWQGLAKLVLLRLYKWHSEAAVCEGKKAKLCFQGEKGREAPGAKQRDREFAEELESHLAMHIEDNLRAGMSMDEARRLSLIKFGGVTLTKEIRREQGRPALETILQNLRIGLRMLRKNPGFSLVAILTPVYYKRETSENTYADQV